MVTDSKRALAEESVIAPDSHCGKELAAWIELIEGAKQEGVDEGRVVNSLQ